eukprot:Tbor_TRINITY_DN3119_c0_g1::TRINITY_DN3119_c0_g1_i1::g.14622::m.14622/K10733/GINS2, PSF2; GINS complex subunit 2
MNTDTSFGKFSNPFWNGFVADQTLIQILPKFTMKAIKGIGGVYGPFQPNVDISVPLWLALYFRQANMCEIVTPHFLKVQFLRSVLEKEMNDDVSYEMLPFHYFEVTMSILKVCRNDIASVTEVIRLVQEIQATRRQKLSKTVVQFQKESLSVPALTVVNLTSLEIDYLRKSLGPIFDSFEALQMRSHPMDAENILTSFDGNGSQRQHGDASMGGRLTTVAMTEASSTTASGGRFSGSVADDQFGNRSLFGELSPSVGDLDDAEQPSQLQFSQGMMSDASATGATTTSAAPRKRRTLRQT